MCNVIIITPLKNEESSLCDVAKSVIRQTIAPKLWVIVDDGSTDGSANISRNLQSRFKWIKGINLPNHPRDITFHYAYVCCKGFDYAIQYCKTNNIYIDYIVLLDADTILEVNYLKKIIIEFNNDPKLGIASGIVHHNINGELKESNFNQNRPSGTGRVWRKDCFLDTGGYLVEPCPDSISNVKALSNDWKIKKFRNIVSTETRQTCSAEGIWQGFKINGVNAYYLNKHPILILLSFCYYILNKPHYNGLSFLYGYLIAALKRKERILDPEIRDYYGKTRIQEYKKNLMQRLFKSKTCIQRCDK
jgi:glycosyltransferase involved in cell wall biosynthesis